MSDPHEQGSVSVTLKQDEPGGKYNDAKVPGSWIVFHGSPAKVREQILETFDMDGSDASLADLVIEATALFKSIGNVQQGLGGKVLEFPKQKAEAKGSGSVFEQAAQEPQGPPWKTDDEPKGDPIIAALEAAQTIAEVQQVWAEHQSDFAARPELMEVYKTRGKALST